MLHRLGIGGKEFSQSLGAYQHEGAEVEVISHATLLIFVRGHGKGVALLHHVAVAIHPVGTALDGCAQHTFYGAVGNAQVAIVGVEEYILCRASAGNALQRLCGKVALKGYEGCLGLDIVCAIDQGARSELAQQRSIICARCEEVYAVCHNQDS